MRVIKRVVKKGQTYYECGREDNEFTVMHLSRKYAITKNAYGPSKISLSRLADTRYYKLID